MLWDDQSCPAASNSDASGAGHTSFSATFGSATTSETPSYSGVTFCGAIDNYATDSQGNTYTEAIRTTIPGIVRDPQFFTLRISRAASPPRSRPIWRWRRLSGPGIHEYSGIATVTPLTGLWDSGQRNITFDGGITTTAKRRSDFQRAVEDLRGSGDTLLREVALCGASIWRMRRLTPTRNQIQSLAGNNLGLMDPLAPWFGLDRGCGRVQSCERSPSPTIASLSPGSVLRELW